MAITMDEAAAALGLCEYCGSRSTLLCDGKMSDKSSCDKRLCRAHAKAVAHVRVQMKGGCRGDTRDLCPDCLAAGRSAW